VASVEIERCIVERVPHVVEVRGAVCCSAHVHCGIVANLHCGACTARGRGKRGGVLFCTRALWQSSEFVLWHSSEFALWSVSSTW